MTDVEECLEIADRIRKLLIVEVDIHCHYPILTGVLARLLCSMADDAQELRVICEMAQRHLMVAAFRAFTLNKLKGPKH